MEQNNNGYNPTIIGDEGLPEQVRSPINAVQQEILNDNPQFTQVDLPGVQNDNVASNNIITALEEEKVIQKVDKHQPPKEFEESSLLRDLDELEGKSNYAKISDEGKTREELKKLKQEQVLGSIPTDTEQDEKFYRITQLVLKFLKKIDLQSDPRYNSNAAYREAVDELITPSEYEEIYANKDLFDILQDYYLNRKLNIIERLNAGKSIEKMKFSKVATNELKYGEDRIGIRSPALGKSGTEDNILAFKAAYRGTVVKIVNLIHSGFTVYINPPSVQEMILLNRILHKEEIDLAKDTASLINSNKRCYLLEPLTSFIEKQIIKCSLNIPISDSVMKYIDIRDYDILLAAIVSSANGNHIHVNYRCANGYELNEDNSAPVCNNEWTLKVDMDKMLFIEHDFLPLDYLKQLSKRDKNTVNVEDVVEYKRKLDERVEHLRTVMIGKLKVVFKIPTIEEYLVATTSYIEELKDRVADANVSKNEQERDVLLKSMLERSEALDIFNSIERLEVVNEETNTTQVLKDQTHIADIVSDLTNEDASELYQACTKFLEESLVAKICYPKTYCSECREKRPDSVKELTGQLPTLTPINMLGFFYQAISIQSM